MPRDRHHPKLALFAALGSAWVFVLVALGAFTTTIGAGMAFSDWPLSNGSVNPPGWMSDLAMFAEHSHRLSGATMGMITIVIAFALARLSRRAWLRRLGWAALAIVILQGLLGGTRVLLDAVPLPGFEMSLGQALRIPHGVLAQLFACLLIAMATGLSKPWIAARLGSVGERTRRLSLLVLVLLLAQLVIAATMRHNHAGLAIPSFPFSSPAGHWLPPVWSFPVAIHFAHRLMAVVLLVATAILLRSLFSEPAAPLLLRSLGALLGAALLLQFALGAGIIWTLREAYLTTAHVVLGTGVLVLASAVTLLCNRDTIERGHA